jgi:hypothetical protein
MTRGAKDHGEHPEARQRPGASPHRDEAGKEHARHFARKVDASKWLDEVTAAVLTGQYVGPKAGRITFRVFFESWAQRQVWASGTRKAMELTAASAGFADVPLRNLRRSHVEAWVKAVERKPLAPGTIHTRVPNLRWRVTPRATLCGLRGASSVLTCDDAEHQTLKRDDHTGFRLVGSP